METQLHPSGLPRTRRRFVDSVQKVASPPAHGVAREEAELVVGGAKVSVVVERQPRPWGGTQGYWHCPRCDRRCCALFVIENGLLCRKCGSLDYRSRHTLNPALLKAAKLRHRIGAAPGLLSRLPPRPPHWRSDYWDRTLAELAAAESVIVELLGATLRAAKRQRVRMDGR